MACDKNPQKIKNMFDEISKYYDLGNNIISFGTHYIIKYFAIKELNIEPRAMVLDLCCGTGDFTKIINKIYPRVKVLGLDFSKEMINIAKTKNPKGVFIQADCTDLPFGEREFQYITMGFGLRNIENRSKALSEIYRVLDKNGKYLHLDFGNHNMLSKVFNLFVQILSKLSKKNTPHYQYLLDSKNEFPEPPELITEFEQHGFKLVKKCEYLLGVISVQIMQK